MLRRDARSICPLSVHIVLWNAKSGNLDFLHTTGAEIDDEDYCGWLNEILSGLTRQNTADGVKLRAA